MNRRKSLWFSTRWMLRVTLRLADRKGTLNQSARVETRLVEYLRSIPHREIPHRRPDCRRRLRLGASTGWPSENVRTVVPGMVYLRPPALAHRRLFTRGPDHAGAGPARRAHRGSDG